MQGGSTGRNGAQCRGLVAWRGRVLVLLGAGVVTIHPRPSGNWWGDWTLPFAFAGVALLFTPALARLLHKSAAVHPCQGLWTMLIS